MSPSAGQSVIETGAPLCTPVPVSEISRERVVCRAPIKPLMAPVGPRAVFLSSLLSSGRTPSPPIDRLSLALEPPPACLCLFWFWAPRSIWANLNAHTGRRQITVSFTVLPWPWSHRPLFCKAFLGPLIILERFCCALALTSICPPAQKGGNLEVVAPRRFGWGCSNFGDRNLGLRFDPFLRRRRDLAAWP